MKKIKKEIIEIVENKHPELVDKVKKELDILSSTEGINDQNNLEVFYNIWQENKNKPGKKNKINSWTAFALGLTSKKPKGDFLPDRRVFARAGFPDIDTDFDDEGRDKIFQYIIDKYGRENVSNIGTHGLLKFKSCITRVTKALDIADSFHKGKEAYVTDNAQMVTEILGSFPKGGVLKIKDDSGKTHIIGSLKDACKYSDDFNNYMKKYPEIKKHAANVEGLFANPGKHAAGVILSDIPLEIIAPLRTTRSGLATQFTAEQLESLGLIKFDILGLSTLSVIKHSIKMIKENYDIDVDITNLPLKDEKTFDLYRTGNLGGVFQCEQWGMQDTIKNIGVDSFDDIMAAIALYRPGPMDSIPEYCARKKGESEIDYFHPSIKKFVKPHLKNTYAILIYQEQLMQICSSLANFSITDGYVMIKAIGKKKKYLMDKYEKQFIDGCMNNKVKKEIAKNYWDKFIVPFANYGFNRSHAASYGLISYITCYLKANYTDEFICSLLNVEILRANHEKIEKYEKEFKRKLPIEILPRDINKCKALYSIEKKKDKSKGIIKTQIRRSLLCKGLGYNSAKNIEENQPYKDLKDFAVRTNKTIVDTKAFTALVENNFIGKGKNVKAKEKLIKDFIIMRQDINNSLRKGVESGNIFE